MIEINDTISLIKAAEQIKPPATYLVDTFFPTVETNLQSTIMMEYRERGREKLAPYVVEGAKGVNMKREGSYMRVYSPPMVAPRRVITQKDVSRRGFGEMPYFSTVSAEERQAKMQADDLADLIGSIANRKNQMAAEILTTGGFTIEGYADDGSRGRLDQVTFSNTVDINVTAAWSDTTTSIFNDLQRMSEHIQEDAGMVPTLLIVGKNVPRYLRKNKEMLDWLMVPNRQNLAVMSFEPKYISPQVQYIGTISALNLEVVCYNETYTADDGTLKPFLGADDVIMGVPGRGTCQHAAITLIDDAETGFRSYAAPYVPSNTVSKVANQMSLTLWSRFILVPNFICDFVHAKVV